MKKNRQRAGTNGQTVSVREHRRLSTIFWFTRMIFMVIQDRKLKHFKRKLESDSNFQSAIIW